MEFAGVHRTIRKMGAASSMTGRLSFAVTLMLYLFSGHPRGLAQQSLFTSDVYATRYLAAHGRRALLSGDTAAGLEGWVYPLQIFRGLEPSFRPEGAVSAMAGKSLLRTIEYAPTYVERIYRGPDFTVHERLFVPRDLPGAVLTYTVESARPIAVELSFTPVFDLMWPVGIGGQEIHWQDAAKAYRLDEPTKHFFALLGSPDAQSHDDLLNTHAPLDAEPRLRLVLGPARQVRLLVASDAHGWSATQAVYNTLLKNSDALAREAAQVVDRQMESSTLIETPDAEVNQALVWSQVALDRAWVCNPMLGCGLVAGYGPSRGLARRPQFDWFFADDALVSLPALLLSGEFTRARDSLLFLFQYQDARTGMMWHELSQSAAYVDWARDYPYMFPHVDVSFRFLVGVAEYARVTGDRSFLADHWKAIDAAYHFCNSLIDPADGLPRVPAGKEGHNEQEHPREELELALDWMEAADAYAGMAVQAGHPELKVEAQAAALRARKVIPEHFWNKQTHFWNAGLDDHGHGIGQMRLPSPASLDLLDEQRRGEILKRLAGKEFETPWGVRSVGSGSRGYDANSYATGSVWATSTATASEDLWQGGLAEQAWQVWRKLLPWLNLDAMGHIHETLSGAAFEPQIESVPEQTWSSALLISSFLDGVAGLSSDGYDKRLSFTPRLPAEWQFFNIKRLRIGTASVDLALAREAGGLKLAASSSGEAVSLLFHPALPAGVKVAQVQVDGRSACKTMQETGCTLLLTGDGARHTIHIRFRGGA